VTISKNQNREKDGSMSLLLVDYEDKSSRDKNRGVTKVTRTPSKYTVKIVLTMVLETSNREQADFLADRVAAFIPADAERVVEAHSPVCILPQGRNKNSKRKAPSPTATASVILVANGTPEAVAAAAAMGSIPTVTVGETSKTVESPADLSARTVRNHAPNPPEFDHSRARANLRASLRSISSNGNRRTSIYTQNS
jgi:hypothetical protein